MIMTLLATLRCIDIHQEIAWTEKRTIKTSFKLKLYEDQLIVKKDVFPLANVFDISCRKDPDPTAIGFLYLHTNAGIKTYHIVEEPTALIRAFEKLKTKRFH